MACELFGKSRKMRFCYNFKGVENLFINVKKDDPTAHSRGVPRILPGGMHIFG
jgi:hypothetical protein